MGVIDQRLVLAFVLGIGHANQVAVDVVLVRGLARVQRRAGSRQAGFPIAFVARVVVGVGVAVGTAFVHAQAVLRDVARPVVAQVGRRMTAGQTARGHLEYPRRGQTPRLVVDVAMLLARQARPVKE